MLNLRVYSIENKQKFTDMDFVYIGKSVIHYNSISLKNKILFWIELKKSPLLKNLDVYNSPKVSDIKNLKNLEYSDFSYSDKVKIMNWSGITILALIKKTIKGLMLSHFMLIGILFGSNFSSFFEFLIPILFSIIFYFVMFYAPTKNNIYINYGLFILLNIISVFILDLKFSNIRWIPSTIITLIVIPSLFNFIILSIMILYTYPYALNIIKKFSEK